MAQPSNSNFKEQCAVCTNEYHQPKLLNCLHSFCQRCLVDKVSGTIDSQSQSILCPLCGKETLVPGGNVELLPSNDLLQTNEQKLLVLLAHSKGTQCQSCLKKAEIFARCLHQDCKHFLCATCEKAHRDMIIFRQHNVVRLKDIEQHRAVPVRKCLTHPSVPLTLYCQSCLKVICVRCKKSGHSKSGHHVIQLTGLTKIQRKDLKHRVHKLKKVGAQFRHAAARAGKFQQKIEYYKKDSEQKANRVHAANFMSQLLLESDDCMFMNLYPKINTAVDDLISSKPGELPCAHNANENGNGMEHDALGHGDEGLDIHQPENKFDGISHSYSEEFRHINADIERRNGQSFVGNSDEESVEEITLMSSGVESGEENVRDEDDYAKDDVSAAAAAVDLPTYIRASNDVDDDVGDDDDDDNDEENIHSFRPEEPSQSLGDAEYTKTVWHRLGKIGKGNPFQNAGGVSVSPINGDVAIADHTLGKADVFSLDGNFKFTLQSQKQCSQKRYQKYSYRLAEDVAFNSIGHMFVVDQSKFVQEFNFDGTYVKMFDILEEGTSPKTKVCSCCIAIDSEDQIYVGDSKRSLVSVFADDGTHIRIVTVSVPPVFLAVNKHMEVLITQGENNSVLLVQMSRVDGPSRLFHIENAANVTGVVWDNNATGFFVASQQRKRGQGQVHFYTSDGRHVIPIVQDKLTNPLGLALSTTNILIVADLLYVKFYHYEEPE